jgi:hypothetical protein
LLEAIQAQQRHHKLDDTPDTKFVVVFKNFDITLWNEIFELAKDTRDVDEDNSIADCGQRPQCNNQLLHSTTHGESPRSGVNQD